MKYSLRRVVKPTEPVLTLLEAYAQLRLDVDGSPPTHPDDVLISAEIAAIAADLDAGTGWLGRALAPQTWELSLSAFPSGACGVKLPYPPYIAVESVGYTDTSGNPQTLVEGVDFRVMIDGDTAWLKPMYGKYWPYVRQDYDAVTIRYRCGYVDGSPETIAVPEQIKQVVKSILTEMYDTRGTYDNAMTRRGEVTERALNTLANIRVYDNRPF